MLEILGLINCSWKSVNYVILSLIVIILNKTYLRRVLLHGVGNALHHGLVWNDASVAHQLSDSVSLFSSLHAQLVNLMLLTASISFRRRAPVDM